VRSDRENQVIESLQERVAQLAINMEKMKLAEYVDLINNPWRLLYINFISGVSRGFGIAVGFAILGAIIILVMQRLVTLNLPVIGGFIADIVEIVMAQLGR
jgi:sulfopyruvate decarboxylase TPP-binding subunit